MSLPLRECGLKFEFPLTLQVLTLSLPSRDCGLKFLYLCHTLILLQSLHLRECGLKYQMLLLYLFCHLSLPSRDCGRYKLLGTFQSNYVVVTGIHHFDYSDKETILELIQKLNKAGKLLKKVEFLYFIIIITLNFEKLSR